MYTNIVYYNNDNKSEAELKKVEICSQICNTCFQEYLEEKSTKKLSDNLKYIATKRKKTILKNLNPNTYIFRVKSTSGRNANLLLINTKNTLGIVSTFTFESTVDYIKQCLNRSGMQYTLDTTFITSKLKNFLQPVALQINNNFCNHNSDNIEKNLDYDGIIVKIN